MALQKNHMTLCAEIQQELSEDKKLYHELCYGKFTKDFTSPLKELCERCDKQDPHITKIYEDMKLLTEIFMKLEPSDPAEDCTIEQSDFSKFKEALRRAVISTEGWKSCQKTRGNMWGSFFPWGWS